MAGLLVVGACASGGDKGDQGRAIAEQAGLPGDVAEFFALAARGLDATYRATYDTTDTAGGALQITSTQRPPDVRVDTFHADGTIDASISVGGTAFQCTMTANQWVCGELGSPGDTGEVFGPTAVQRATDQFRRRAEDYDFRVEPRTVAGAAGRCLVTTRKPGREVDATLGASATLCVSPEGVILLAEVPSGSITATTYTTTIPPDAFTLPAPVGSSTTSTSSPASAGTN